MEQRFIKFIQKMISEKKMHLQFIGWLSIFVLAVFITASFPYPALFLAFLPFSSPFSSSSLCVKGTPHSLTFARKQTATLLLWAILFPYVSFWRIAYDNDFKTGQLALLSVLAYVNVCYSFWPQYQTRLLSFLAVKAPINESTETYADIQMCWVWKWRLWVKAWPSDCSRPWHSEMLTLCLIQFKAN